MNAATIRQRASHIRDLQIKLAEKDQELADLKASNAREIEYLEAKNEQKLKQLRARQKGKSAFAQAARLPGKNKR